MTRLSDYDASQSCEALVAANHRITPPDVPEVRSILLTIAHPDFSYREGQNVGISVPGSKAFGQDRLSQGVDVVHPYRDEVGHAAPPLDCACDAGPWRQYPASDTLAVRRWTGRRHQEMSTAATVCRHGQAR